MRQKCQDEQPQRGERKTKKPYLTNEKEHTNTCCIDDGFIREQPEFVEQRNDKRTANRLKNQPNTPPKQGEKNMHHVIGFLTV